MHKKLCIHLIFLIFTAFPLLGIEIETDYTGEKYYRTIGTMETEKPFDTVKDILTDFSSYNRWATRGLDGKEPGTENFVGLLKDTAYDQNKNIFDIIYDVRLPWPLGSYDNKASFTVDDVYAGGDAVSFVLNLTNNSALLKDASLSVCVYPDGEGCRVESTALVRFTFLLNMFFSLPSYRKTIEWRIMRVMANMETYVDEYEVCSAAGG